jgi:hypothetical protein
MALTSPYSPYALAPEGRGQGEIGRVASARAFCIECICPLSQSGRGNDRKHLTRHTYGVTLAVGRGGLG